MPFLGPLETNFEVVEMFQEKIHDSQIEKKKRTHNCHLILVYNEAIRSRGWHKP